MERSIESKGETAETSEPGQAVIHHHVYRHSCFGSQLVRAYSCSYSVSLATLSCFGHPSCRIYDKASCILNHSASETNASFLSLSLLLHNINIGGRFIINCRHRLTRKKKKASNVEIIDNSSIFKRTNFPFLCFPLFFRGIERS